MDEVSSTKHMVIDSRGYLVPKPVFSASREMLSDSDVKLRMSDIIRGPILSDLLLLT